MSEAAIPGLVPLAALPDKPLVSVLTANYNYAEYVGEAIRSVQAQTYQHWELVICDDGSSDDSEAVIRRFAAREPRIVVLSQENQGQASAVNRSFSVASGEVVCMLDADDAFTPTKIQKVVEAFRAAPESGMVIHNLQVIDGDGRPRRVARFHRDGHLGSEIPTLRMGLPIPQASGLSFRRAVLTEILPLPETEFRSVADWAIGYAAAFITRTVLVPEVLARYRIHDRNLSGTTSTAGKLEAVGVEKILRGVERVLGFVNRFLQRRSGAGFPTSRVRNLLEHRLILGLLRRDRKATSRAAADLGQAYEEVRRDYPAWRFYFWRTLAVLPFPVSRPLLQLSFQVFRLWARLRPST